MEVVPLLAETLTQVKGALAIDGVDALLDFGARFKPRAQTADTFTEWGIDEDVVYVALFLQDALGTAADDDAIAVSIGLLDDLAGELSRDVGIEGGACAGHNAGSECGTAHGLAVHAA